MDWLTQALLAAVVVGAIGVYLSSTAGRLDRLHHRLETTYAALDAQLLRRAAAAQELASSGLLDPASSLVLAEAAQGSLAADPDDESRRSIAESELTRTVGTVLATREDVDEVRASAGPDLALANLLLVELAVGCRRVGLARRFHNDVVRSTLQLRSKRVVRWFRLAGHTPLPSTSDFDDTPPAGVTAI